MKLLPHELKIALLKAPQLYLTNQRLIRDGDNYGSVNLRDITIIKTETVANIGPIILGLGILALSYYFFDGEYLNIGLGIFMVSLLYFLSQIYSHLDIHAPGSGSISVRINFMSKKTIREFIYKVETEMERVKKESKYSNHREPNQPVTA